MSSICGISGETGAPLVTKVSAARSRTALEAHLMHREWYHHPMYPVKGGEMPQGDKSAYTDKQKRKAEHIEEG